MQLKTDRSREEYNMKRDIVKCIGWKAHDEL